MERGDLSLEESVSAYERGVALHRYCEDALSTAERKLRILAEGSGRDGEQTRCARSTRRPGIPVPRARESPRPPPREAARSGTTSRADEGDGLPF